MKTAARSQSRRKWRERDRNPKGFPRDFAALKSVNGEPPLIQRARQYIARNYREDVSLSDVARALNMDVFYFCRLFKKSSGVGFAEYLGRIRTATAMELLASSELPVSAIAFDVGFQALSTFNRLFRQFTRMSPTEYRTIYRQKRNGRSFRAAVGEAGCVALEWCDSGHEKQPDPP